MSKGDITQIGEIGKSLDPGREEVLVYKPIRKVGRSDNIYIDGMGLMWK